jgi:hypothetical protein
MEIEDKIGNIFVKFIDMVVRWIYLRFRGTQVRNLSMKKLIFNKVFNQNNFCLSHR